MKVGVKSRLLRHFMQNYLELQSFFRVVQITSKNLSNPVQSVYKAGAVQMEHPRGGGNGHVTVQICPESINI